MFHKIFKSTFCSKLHSKAPYPKERLIYLNYLQEHGASLLSLQKIASILLVGAHCLTLDSKKKVTAEEINKNFVRFSRQPKNLKKRGMILNAQYRKIYPYHVKKWLKIIGQLDDVIKIDYPFSKQLLSFENYQRNERRLTETSIKTSSFILKIFFKYIFKKKLFFSEIFVQKISMVFLFIKGVQITLDEPPRIAQQQSVAS